MCSEGLRERYVNPYTNFAFKLLFGTDLNKEILIGFLNALFDFSRTGVFIMLPILSGNRLLKGKSGTMN